MIAEEGKAGRKIGETWSAILVPSPAASNTRRRPASYSRCAPAPKRQAGDGRGRRGRNSGGDSFEAGLQPNRLAEAGYRGGRRFRRRPCLVRASSGPGDSVAGQRQPPKSCPMEIPTIVNLSSRGSRAALSAGAARFCSFLRRPAAWKLATAPKRTEAAGAFQHVMNSFHSSSPATQAKGCVWADAGSRLHRETHVALLADARLALDPFPTNLSCHGSV